MPSIQTTAFVFAAPANPPAQAHDRPGPQALVGPRPSPLPNPLRFSSLVPQSTTSTDGLLRRQILTPLLSELLEHLRRLPIIGVPLAAAREHLAFAALVWKVCGSSDMRMERQRVTGEVVCRAFDLLDLPECVGDAREGILLSLSELAVSEFFSLLSIFLLC